MLVFDLSKADCPHCDAKGQSGYRIVDPLVLHVPCGSVHRATRLLNGVTTGVQRATIMAQTANECFCDQAGGVS